LDYQPGIAFSDLTGWYEAGYDNFNQSENACLQLNQAGDRLIGWLQDRDLNRYDIDAELVAYDPAASAPLAYAVSGAGPGAVSTIDMLPRNDPTELGVRVEVEGTTASHIYTLVRRHRYALIPPPVLAAVLGGRAPADFETQCLPLHSRAELAIENARRAIVRSVAEMRVLIDRSGWDDGAMNLAYELRDILSDGGVLRFELVHDANNNPVTVLEETKMLQRFRLLIQQALRATVPVGDNRDVLSRLREITTWVESETDAISDIALLSTIVGIAPAPHLYSLTMAEIGPTADLEVVAGGWGGIVAIPTVISHSAACAEPGAPQPHDWWDVYAGVMGQAGVGVGTDVRFKVEVVTVSTGNDLTAALEWRPDDFVGCPFVLYEAAGGGSLYPGAGAKFGPGASLGKEYEAYTFFSRDKGWATGRGDGEFMSFGWMIAESVGGPWAGPVGFFVNPIGGKVGVLLARLGLANPQTPPPPPPPPTPLELTMTVESTVGFAFGSAELSDTAKTDLARIVARHRQLFELPNAHLEIEGDASPPGSDPFNDRLSWERALAVYAYVMSLLSVPASIDGWWGAANAVAVRDNRTELLGNGEMKARYSKQRLPNRDWQRCKLAINGQMMVLL
jgi:outer membrane protein OmpA-like peptidoglycan-associated protein